MTLRAIITGNRNNAGWITEGGSVLMIGDSITSQAQCFPVGGLDRLDGTGNSAGSVGGSAVAAAWNTAASVPPPTGYIYFGASRTTTFTGSDSPAVGAWNANIVASVAGGLNFAGSGNHEHRMELASLQRPWLRETLAASAVIVRVAIQHGPTGVTGENIRLNVGLNGSTTGWIEGPYFSTYSPTSQTVWHEVEVPIQASMPDGYSMNVWVNHRPSTPTVNNQTFTIYGLCTTVRRNRRPNSFTFFPVGVGGQRTDEVIDGGTAARRVNRDCLKILMDGLGTTHLIVALGVNGRSPAADYVTDITQLINHVQEDHPAKIILLSTPATIVGTGGQLGSMEHVIGASTIAAARTDTLHLNTARVIPPRDILFQGKTNTWSTTPNGTLILPGDIYIDGGKRWMSKIWQVKTAATPVLTTVASWADTGTWTSLQNIDPLADAHLQDLGDGTHPTFPEGMKIYRTAIQSLHYAAMDDAVDLQAITIAINESATGLNAAAAKLMADRMFKETN